MPRTRALAIRSLTDLSWEQDGKTTKLHGFEIAALANLVQEDTDVEEIVALGESLNSVAPDVAIAENEARAAAQPETKKKSGQTTACTRVASTNITPWYSLTYPPMA